MTVGAQKDVDEKVPLKKVKTIEWKKVEKCFLCENLEIFYSNNAIIYLSCIKLLFLSWLDLFPNRYSHQCSIETESSNCDKKQSLKK